MTKRLEHPKFQAFDANGDPLSGGKVYTYEPGTTTEKVTYSDYDAQTENTNPIILDSRGECVIYLRGSYKIVLKDSNDVTIWTMDNISGGLDETAMGDFYYPDATATDQGVTGNSDTIKYAVDTASSDEASIYFQHDSGGTTTTYTLTTSESVPSTIMLYFEPGVRINGAGTLTLDNPGQIKAEKNQQIFGSSVTVSFTNPGRVFPGWWGADTTGASDSATQMQSAVDSLTSGTVDIKDFSWRWESTITLDDNIEIDGYGCTIDFSNADNADYMIHILGSQDDTPRSLTANALVEESSVSVASASSYFSTGDWTILRDNGVWDLQSSGKVGEWVYVLSADTTTVTLGDTLLYSYYTSDAAVLDVMTLKKNITIKGIKATGSGSGGGQYGILAQWCQDIKVIDCELIDFETNALGFYRVAELSAINNIIRNSSGASNGYGIQCNGCVNGLVSNNRVENCRSGMDMGAALLPSRFITYSENFISGCKDYGIETHSTADYITIDGNQITSGRSDGTLQHGIRVAGVNPTICNNTIVGTEYSGITHEVVVDNGDLPTYSHIINNRIIRCGIDAASPEPGIYISQSTIYNSDVPFEGIIVSGNYIEDPGSHGIFLYAQRNYMRQINITNNVVIGVSAASRYCIWCKVLTGYDMYDGVVSNNVCTRDDDLAANISLEAVDATSIYHFAVIGNVTNNGTYGIACTNEDYFAIVGNACRGYATGNVYETGGNNSAANNV